MTAVKRSRSASSVRVSSDAQSNPRRSTRNRATQQDGGIILDGTDPDVKKASEGQRGRRTRTELRSSGNGAKRVKEAMKDLSEMEKRLQNEAKRQRLAIANSDVRCKPDIDLLPLEAPDGTETETDDSTPMQSGAQRPPPVNSDYLPLPWKGRLGYACLNTYLRTADPPVFSSRTCRLASILEHRHPLMDPTMPEHPTKNRPDKTKPAKVELGQKYVEALGLANAKDIVKMIRWNHKYGIKFMRLSSEMFPFASHAEYGYDLAPFASEVLAEAGRVAAELDHRLTTHPGQYTQLGSPRSEVVTAAVRDLIYHDEMLTLLKLPPQLDRDAVMILHMGGVFGDKEATVERFKKSYATLPESVKRRLVLENDDVSWSVHDLLPICEELNIPMVLDFHHHNIIFDATQVREGTADIVQYMDRIRTTWTRKGITPKMHYSEPCNGALTGRERRKHSARVRCLPPCPPDMDLMIEAKDKEQAVFELMRTYKLPGFELINDMVPNEREDDDRVAKIHAKLEKARNRKKKKAGANELEAELEVAAVVVEDEAFGMGGPLNRVYWPEGFEEWLKPKKRDVNRPKSTRILDESE